MDMLTALHYAAWSLQKMAQDRDGSQHPPPAAPRIEAPAARRVAAWFRRPRRATSPAPATACCR